MTEQKINKSDYTDRKGVVHPSIGENIRSDNNQLSADYLNSMGEDERLMFPFFPFKKGKWVRVTDTITNEVHTADKYYSSGTNTSMRVDYKVKYAIEIKSEIDALYSGVSFIVPRSNGNQFTVIYFNKAVTAEHNNKKIIFYFYVED